MSLSKEFSYVPRVDQLDAIQLDRELWRLLRDGFVTSFQKLVPEHIARFQLEVDLFINSAIWFATVGRKFSTYGQQLLLISYNQQKLTKSRLVLHFILNIVFKYAKDNIEQRYTEKKRLQDFLNWTENMLLILSVINFFRFLKTGRHPTLVDFILGLDYISLSGGKPRQIGYEYMSRELIWDGLIEVIGFVLPLINYKKLQRYFTNIFTKSKKPTEILKVNMDENTLCTFCDDRPVMPHHMGCGHVFCYYCLQSNLMADSGFVCPKCGMKSLVVKQVIVKDD